MVDTINCIIDAEKKAENIVAHANESAKAIILEGEREAEQIINTAIYSVKVSRLAKLKKATEKAEEKYNQKIEEGKVTAQKLYDNALLKVDNVAVEIVEEILK